MGQEGEAHARMANLVPCPVGLQLPRGDPTPIPLERLLRKAAWQIGKILRDLCRQRGIDLVEGRALPDHVRLCLSISPKQGVA
jgi:hypothetical protein